MIASDADILAHLGQSHAPLLGFGGEARVYGLADKDVLRIMRPGARMAEAEARASLLAEIAAGARASRFRTPRVGRLLEIEGRIVSFELLLCGEPVSQLLTRLGSAERQALLADYLESASAISSIAFEREFYGPLIGNADLRAADWNGFLRARLRRSLAMCPADLRPGVAEAMAASLPEPDQPALVHLDYFPGNVLAQGGRVVAVLDFGPSSVMGDARMEAWSAVAYLDAELSPAVMDADRTQALAWLAERDLLSDYPRARRWLAAYWSFAADDANLMAWCRKILLFENA